MSRITFVATNGLEWSVAEGALRVAVEITDADGSNQAETLYFTVPSPFHAHPDLVCVGLSMLCGGKYKSVAFDFAGSERAKRGIEAAYGVTVEFSGAPCAPRQSGERMALNFSGGFDSMTALALTDGLPMTLLSMDFGGYFTRETDYFRTFNPIVCSTDLRQKGFHLNDWRFMAIGSLLMADMLNLGTIGFGTILEASPWNFRNSYRAGPSDDRLFGSAGLVATSWIRGLTEVGTAMVMLALEPDAIAASLESLAARGSEKLLRKSLLIEIAAEALGLPMPAIGPRVPVRQPAEYGKSFTIDFLALYFLKRFGRNYVSTFISGLPDDPGLNEVLAANLDFYMKYNPGYLVHIPVSMRNHVLGRMHEAGLYPYTEVDFESFGLVRQYLGRNYPVAAQRPPQQTPRKMTA